MKLLLLHGIGGAGSIWQASGTVDALAAAGWPAHAINFPGYAGAPGEPTLAAMVQAVLGAGGDEPLLLLGHSMGGMVAQEVAALHPGRVRGLILACTSAAFGKADGDWQARFVAERVAPLDAGLGMAGVADKLVPGMVSPQAPPAALQAARDVMARVPEATYRVALAAIARFDRREALASIAVPTLLIAGEHDRTAPPELMQRMAARIAGSQFVLIERAGHIANVEQPVAFNAAALAFLQQHFAGA